MVRPAVVEFLELAASGAGGEVDLEEVVLQEGCRASGIAVRDLARHGVHVSVVAIKRGTDPVKLRPGPDEPFEPGDRVIVVGDRDDLARLAELAQSGR